jgi:transposase
VDVSTKPVMDTSEERRPRKRWPEALKREIVAATFAPGASVSVVARQYDVNANQVFSWRRRYSEAGKPSPASPSTCGLVPMTITAEPEDEGAMTPPPAASQTIEIEVSGTYRVRVGARFDGRALRRVLDVLGRR